MYRMASRVFYCIACAFCLIIQYVKAEIRWLDQPTHVEIPLDKSSVSVHMRYVNLSSEQTIECELRGACGCMSVHPATLVVPPKASGKVRVDISKRGSSPTIKRKIAAKYSSGNHELLVFNIKQFIPYIVSPSKIVLSDVNDDYIVKVITVGDDKLTKIEPQKSGLNFGKLESDIIDNNAIIKGNLVGYNSKNIGVISLYLSYEKNGKVRVRVPVVVAASKNRQ